MIVYLPHISPVNSPLIKLYTGIEIDDPISNGSVVHGYSINNFSSDLANFNSSKSKFKPTYLNVDA